MRGIKKSFVYIFSYSIIYETIFILNYIFKEKNQLMMEIMQECHVRHLEILSAIHELGTNMENTEMLAVLTRKNAEKARVTVIPIQSVTDL